MNYGLRMQHCIQMIKNCLSLPGDFAECGVAGGDLTFVLDKYVLPANKKLWAFDTFEGLPYSESEALYKGRFSDLHAGFWNRLEQKEQTSIIPVKGLIEKTLKDFADLKFCFVWLDLDLCEPTRFAYRFFENRMVPGGIIGFHDYDFDPCPGIKVVVDEEVDKGKYEEVFNKDICYFIRRKTDD